MILKVNNINGDTMLIKDICKEELICADKNSSLQEISNLMNIHNIGFIPIKNNDQIIGLITDRDIIIRGIAQNKNNINDIMTTSLISIDSNQNIDEALKLLKKHQIKRLLVMENNNYIGVISLSDILKSNDDNKILDTIKQIFSEKNNKENIEVDSFYL